MKTDRTRITLRAVLWGAFFAGLFAVLTTILDSRRAMYVTANQVPLFPYLLLLLTLVLVNPLCRLVRVVRPFSRTEVLIMFIMGTVSSGIASFGLCGELVPVMGSLFNRHWNNDQTEWNLYAEPFLNEHFFVSEPGIRRAATEYRAALLRAAELRRVAESAEAKVPGGDADAASEAESARARHEQGEQVVAGKKATLEAAEAGAFEKVELFRRGLPAGKRAFPGFVPVIQEDSAATCFGRLRRLVYGKKAAAELKAALRAMRNLPQETPLNASASARVADRLSTAAETLARAGSPDASREELADLRERERLLTDRIDIATKELVALNEDKRRADLDAARRIESRIADLRGDGAALEKEKRDIAFALERNLVELQAAQRVTATSQALTALREDLLRDEAPTASAVAARLRSLLAEFPAFDASLRRYFLGDVPWSHWIGPLWRWGLLIGLTYLVLMTFNILIFRQWAYHEKLVYPLAELPESLAGDDMEDRIVPAIFGNGLFWAGFAVSVSVLGWNLLCAADVLPGMAPLDLANNWSEYTTNTPFVGIGSIGRSSIFFTMIGLAFLIPKKVSFSLWFFWVLAMVQLQILVWSGYGQSAHSFPSEWWYTLNFRTAEGGGALLVFASVALFKSRRYLLCALRSSLVSDLPADESRELRISSFLFLAGSLGIVMMLWRGLGVSVFYAAFGYLFVMVVTIGLVRAVAEGGILSYKAYFGPFHFIRNTLGFDNAWTSPSLVAPLMVYYSVLLLDIKAFIAPAMANAIKIRDDLGMRRARFHTAIFICIAVGLAMSVIAALIMAYASGADAMSSWFYSGFPRGLFDRIGAMSKTPPTATPEGRFWLGFGAVAMAALLYFRQRLFWLPHPIGMIMLVNPIMQTFWFSVFVGWIAKTLVTRYGNKDTYAKLRGLFIGLIAGEIILVAVATIVSLILGRNMGIDLNRN